MNHLCKKSILFFLLVTFVGFWAAQAQIGGVTRPQVQEAERQLQQMTPEEIDAKIKELGLTREQAETQAKAYGVDLNQYLQGKRAPASTHVVTPLSGGTAVAVPVFVQPAIAPAQTSVPAISPVMTAPEVKKDGLPYFGYDIFTTVPAGFEPTASGPADPDYVIGPDDVLRITVWGQYELNEELTVDKEGRISIRTIGPVVVTGQTLQQVNRTLLRALARSYSGLLTEPPTAFMDITISKLRPKRVFIMGEVANPGGYTVGSYATVFSSLFSVGGPTVKGTMRDIRVIRNNRIIARVDLYDYLTGAEKINDIRVQNNDIIQVPPRGRTIALSGNVRRPAIYELKQGEQMKSLLDFAGGVESTAYLERVQISRILPFAARDNQEPERVFIDLNFRNILLKNQDYEVTDGDKISVFQIRDEQRNFVTIEGAVRKPGRFQLEQALDVRTLVLKADSLLPESYLDRADLFRTRLDGRNEVFRIDLSKALRGEGGSNIRLEPYDKLQVYSNLDLIPNRQVSIEGHVLRPGKYPHADSLLLSDLIFKAGGLTDSLYRARTYLLRADLLRLDSDRRTYRTIPFNLEKLLDGDTSEDRLLIPEDRVIIYDIESAEFINKFVEIRGEVRRPGVFNLTTNMHVSDLILLAGGFTESAYRVQGEIARMVKTRSGNDSLVTLYEVELPLFESKGGAQLTMNEASREKDILLSHRDVLIIRKNPFFRPQEFVSISGEIFYQGDYSLNVPNERLSEIIDRAGGLKKTAFLKGGRLFRGENRVNADFEKAIGNRLEKEDIILQPGDRIVIPKRPHSVKVIGEVNFPGIQSFIEGNSLSDYLERAGGESDSADYALVVYPSGLVRKVGLGWFSGNPRIEDGSEIIVTRIPPKPPEEKVSIYNEVKDYLALLVSLVTVLVLTKQL